MGDGGAGGGEGGDVEGVSRTAVVRNAKATVACWEAGALDGQGGAVGRAVGGGDDESDGVGYGGVGVEGGGGGGVGQHAPHEVVGDGRGDEAGEL